jgi:hypothetical protein
MHDGAGENDPADDAKQPLLEDAMLWKLFRCLEGIVYGTDSHL